MERGISIITTVIIIMGLLASIWLEVDNWELWVMGIPAVLGMGFCLLFAKKYFIYLTGVLLPLSISIPIINGAYIQFPVELMVAALGMVFLIYLAFKPGSNNFSFWSHPVSLWILLDLALAMLAVINSEFPIVSMKRWAAKAVFALVFFFMMGNWLNRSRDFEKLILIFCGGLGLVAIYALWQHSQYSFGIPYSPAMARPFFDDHTIYGANLAMFYPILGLIFIREIRQSNRKKWGILALVLIFSAGIFFSFSRAVWLSLIITGLVWGVWHIGMKINWNRYRVFIAATIFLGIVFIGANQGINWVQQNRAQSVDTSTLEHLASSANIQTNTSNRERINRWLCAIRLFEERPLLGWGPGTYQYVYGPFQKFEEMTRISTYQGDRGNAHSEYLTYLSETGLIGLFGFLGLIITAFYRSLKEYKLLSSQYQIWTQGLILGLLTFLLHGFFNSFLDQVKISGVFYLFLAILVIIDLKKEN